MARRFRFSIRTLAILITLVCAYFGVWEATKRYSFPNSITAFVETGKSYTVMIDKESPLPLLVLTTELVPDKNPLVELRRCYFWCFGLTVKLPVERELPTRYVGTSIP